MSETNDLLRALLTAQVLNQAQWMFSLAQQAAMPRMVDAGVDADGHSMLKNINPLRVKTWDDCLREAVDALERNQPAVLDLLKERGLLPR